MTPYVSGVSEHVTSKVILLHYGIALKIVSIIRRVYDGFSCNGVHDLGSKFLTRLPVVTCFLGEACDNSGKNI